MYIYMHVRCFFRLIFVIFVTVAAVTKFLVFKLDAIRSSPVDPTDRVVSPCTRIRTYVSEIPVVFRPSSSFCFYFFTRVRVRIHDPRESPRRVDAIYDHVSYGMVFFISSRRSPAQIKKYMYIYMYVCR